jgi:hypothetical protein
MKVHAQNLIASVAAILFTTASLGTLYHNVGGQPAPTTEINTSKIATLATIHVHPSAAERRAAALLPRVSTTNTSHSTVTPLLGTSGGSNSAEPLSLLGAPLAMPYYSFDKKLGSISKE